MNCCKTKNTTPDTILLHHLFLRISFFFFFFLLLFPYHYHVGRCDSDVGLGYRVTLAIPPAYSPGFVGRAYLMETDDDDRQNPGQPIFRTALTVLAQAQQDDDDDEYSCSLDLFLGNVKVWSSAHFSRFYTSDKCTLELTQLGDLVLKGLDDRVGWRSGTAGQGVQRLHLLRSGNLVLVDSQNSIKWQTFNFPTDIMLWGQRLSSRTRLTSFIITTTTNNSDNKNNSSGGANPMFYTFEVQYDKIVLFLNHGKMKYSYWEFRPPSGEHNITYVELTSTALEIYNGNFQKVAQISTSPSQSQQQLNSPLRFLALENATGNLGLYYYSTRESGFQASFQALNTTCDLPLACDPYGICTLSQTCSCINLVTRTAVEPGWRRTGGGSSCGGVGLLSSDSGGNNIDDQAAEMVELRGVTSVLKGALVEVDGSKARCENFCLKNNTCVAALYTTSSSSDEGRAGCYVYGLVRGIKQVDSGRSNALMMGGSGTTYMIKVSKGTGSEEAQHQHSGLKRWVVIVIGVGDGLLIFVVVGGIGYYFIYYRPRTTSN
ncbi:OLC1v1001893C1 [Oldenlandia corymbosa var. corymbosa]|uniref:OLC1v1001893C1 n=1 Tax=Oldenlandia corymbosa var. corymbosa TaxID=529605 RepID=A0AAV1D6D2_OLDCO|nr:OLC1v1001893C1 [Oldenlandia corymbosa var. corymbosa]